MHRLLLFPVIVSSVLLPSCAAIPGKSPDGMSQSVDRYDEWIDRRAEKRSIRSQSADERYNAWWDRTMGR
jgi:transcription elongation factor Elf1